MLPVLLNIGPITIHTYGLLVGIGFLLAFFAARLEFRRRRLSEAALDRLAFYLMIGGILGARILYFAVDGFATLRADPLSFFRIWEGGLVFYGGALAGIAILIVCARRMGVSFLTLSDAFAAPLLLGQAIGRLGCFAAGCCYGRPTGSFVGVTFTDSRALAPLYEKLHPTQLYEFAGDLILFALVTAVSKRSRRPGSATCLYLAGYGAFRFALEFVRGDDRGFVIQHLYPSQWIAAAAILTGCIGYAVLRQREA